MTKKILAMPISSFLPHLGGMEVGLHNIAIRMQKKSWEPVVIAPYSHVKALKEANWELPYTVEAFPPKIFTILYHFPTLGFWLLNRFLDKMNKRYNFDFWHVTMGYPTGCAVIEFAEFHKKRHKTDISYLVRCAGEDIQKQPDIQYGMRLDPRLDKVISSILPKAQHLVAITQSVKEEYKKLGVAPHKILNIPNGVDVKRFKTAQRDENFRKDLGLSPDDILILSVGRNHPKKNFKALIDAAEALVQKGITNFKLLIVGKGTQDLQRYISKDLATHIILKEQLGSGQKPSLKEGLNLPSPDLIACYKAADIFAFPSLTETFGIVLVEAMAAGLPVATSDADGCRDIAGKGEWALLHDLSKPEIFHQNLENLIKDRALREHYSAKSIERATHYDWDTVVDQYIQVYSGNTADTSKAAE